MDIDLDELERLARAATSGAWVFSRFGLPYVSDGKGGVIVDTQYSPNPKLDAAYIASANPAVVLELIDEIRNLRLLIRPYETDVAK